MTLEHDSTPTCDGNRTAEAAAADAARDYALLGATGASKTALAERGDKHAIAEVDARLVDTDASAGEQVG
eukprot:CAMPEP_0172914910 /NCGR_PEP_ID=MMETSP1075-20121228/193262_1 /TAXON_ID=2916 /ORGANISM="Ceratium fusus, Strain PA161109" /LENGTH=69 /DNA_ID=CAMNT_0013773889 /DNA_START=50 /DNA_END=256 /DNA_ORIENTATION=-